ncbi:ATP-binding cassette domain-containing protein [Nocardioides pantholopis]|uniref:ATP-binding cassette domain-containing protein n=1 Tax=Nocardioides pantholopis TaxID=2483798 RepID=UPI000F09780A|nr:ATP-binding cassette domain-containing protein [Nocardioides pantholopis]
MSAALRVAGLSAGYRGLLAVRDVSFEVPAGTVLALLGPNGAGKSTTLLAVVGAIRRAAGEVSAFGRPLGRRTEQNARAGVTLVPDDRGVFHRLSVADNLRLARNPAGLEPVLDDFPRLRALWSRRWADERGLAVVLVEQHVDLALSIADRAAVLHHGRVALVDDAAVLRADRRRVEDAYFGRTDPV